MLVHHPEKSPRFSLRFLMPLLTAALRSLTCCHVLLAALRLPPAPEGGLTCPTATPWLYAEGLGLRIELNSKPCMPEENTHLAGGTHTIPDADAGGIPLLITQVWASPPRSPQGLVCRQQCQLHEGRQAPWILLEGGDRGCDLFQRHEGCHSARELLQRCGMLFWQILQRDLTNSSVAPQQPRPCQLRAHCQGRHRAHTSHDDSTWLQRSKLSEPRRRHSRSGEGPRRCRRPWAAAFAC
mmetsp:Transcript_467/g.1257  ORF Transcript_467/g.1257 Transcript_467/m.1257 type:complete len:239 (-) Transcript_467:24-740(-)